jgi:hypothetical protein
VRELRSDDASLQQANEHGVALLAAGRPEAALSVFNAAVPGPDRKPDALLGAIHLNRACALLQISNASAGVEAAKAAQEAFSASRDTAGLAQATHLSGVGLKLAGNNEAAQAMFQRAAEIAKGLAPKAAGDISVRDAFAPPALTVALASAPLAAASAASVRSLSPHLTDRVTRDPALLQPVINQDAQTLTFRLAGRVDGWGVLPLIDDSQRSQQLKPWSLSVAAGEKTVSFSLGNSQVISLGDLVANVYKPRLTAQTIAQLGWSMGDAQATTLYLTHLYGYALPLKIADAYYSQQLFAKAEEYYLAAAQYSFLNLEIEGTLLWVRLAINANDWGDSLFIQDDTAGAKEQFEKVVTTAGGVPASPLYTLAGLAVPAGLATTFIGKLAVRPLPLDDWEIDAAILNAFRQLQQIAQGLDYYGLLLAPIHTFEYLQSVAQGFAREAIDAENQFTSFKMRQATDEATRRELEIAKASAEGEESARHQAFLSAQQDESAAKATNDLADKRAQDASDERQTYTDTSAADLWGRVAAQALSGGQDGLVSEISELADRLDRGETLHVPGPKLAAAELLSAGRKTQKYELQKMKDNVDELDKAKKIAADQLAAAQSRTLETELAWQAAQKRVELASAALEAFDGQLFTPDAWSKMANVMQDIASGYLFRAIRLAKLMERAYNFENDSELKIIQNDYGIAATNPNASGSSPVLGGQLLLQDVESFIYSAVTTRSRKSARIKDVLSVAEMFPAQFDTFRRTARLTFETDLYEFDRLHPGFYGQKLQAVELEVIGLLPESGLNGSFTGGGVTSFRRVDGSQGKRSQIVDTMALSQYTSRGDAFLYTAETGVKGLFQGFGVSTTWQLHTPRRSNNLDLRRIFDVRLILYYTAQYDAGLEASVLATPVRPGELAQIRDFGLRYDFPDAWFGFYSDGIARVNLEQVRLPMNQTNFRLSAANVRVVMKPGVAAAGLSVRLAEPGGKEGMATTDANGIVTTADPALALLAGVNPVGGWQIQVVGGASLNDAGGVPQFNRVYNIQFGLEYEFDFVSES